MRLTLRRKAQSSHHFYIPCWDNINTDTGRSDRRAGGSDDTVQKAQKQQQHADDVLLASLAVATTNAVAANSLPVVAETPLLAGAPTFSILTPSLNRAHYLEAALRSVVTQSGPAVEHIVIDGGSHDGTQEILARFPHLRVVSEPDRNSHHALNKGLALATGAVVGFVMSDDHLVPGALTAVANAFVTHPEAQAVVGRAFLAEGERLVAEFVHCPGHEGMWHELLFGTPAFCSWFFRRDWLERLGGFDERLVIAADRDLLIRGAVAGMELVLLPVPVYIYGLHSQSATLAPGPDQIARLLEEHCAIARRLIADSQLAPAVAGRLKLWYRHEIRQAFWHAWRRRAWVSLVRQALRLVFK